LLDTLHLSQQEDHQQLQLILLRLAQCEYDHDYGRHQNPYRAASSLLPEDIGKDFRYFSGMNHEEIWQSTLLGQNHA